MSVLDLQNAEKWAIRDSQFFSAPADSLLPLYESAVEFSSPIIGVLVANSLALDTWNYAGLLSQMINLPFGPSPASSAATGRKLWLRQKQLFIFPDIVPDYRISVRFPRWFTQASIAVWEYQGETANIENQLSGIELKINSLLQQHPPP